MSRSDVDSFRVRDVLELLGDFGGDPVLLTPSADLDRTVRWSHVIGQARPAEMLTGGEVVLSTLPRINETSDDPQGLLEAYLDDLEQVGAAAAFLEVLEDRVALRRALGDVAARRAPHGLPVVLFRSVIRFVDVTEKLHRELLSRQAPHGESRRPTPIEEQTAALLAELQRPEPDQAAVRELVQALGLPWNGVLLPLVLGPVSAQSFTRKASAAVVRRIREAMALFRIQGMVAELGEDVVLVVAGADQARAYGIADRLLRRLQQIGASSGQTGRERLIAAAGTASSWVELAAAFEDAKQTMTAVRAIGAQAVGQQKRPYVLPSDLGAQGLLAQIDNQPAVEWFTHHVLGRLQSHPMSAELKRAVGEYLDCLGNKSLAAQRLGISRPTLYQRLEQAERSLGVSLDAPGAALSLGLALKLDAATQSRI